MIYEISWEDIKSVLPNEEKEVEANVIHEDTSEQDWITGNLEIIRGVYSLDKYEQGSFKVNGYEVDFTIL